MLGLSAGTGRAALERALSALVERHEVLRTVFLESEDALPRQRIEAAQAVQLTERTFDTEEELSQYVAQFNRRPFDLTCGALYRGELLHGADGQTLLAWCMHEIIADGSSCVS